MKYLIFGTGEYYRKYVKWFDKADIIALLDNDPVKRGSVIDDKPVLSPEEVIRLDYDYIVILSFFFTEMMQQLLTLGVPRCKILHFYDICSLSDCLKKSFPAETYLSEINRDKDSYKLKESILLLSQDLDMTGPAIALSKAAYVFRDHGYRVVFASMIDGSLKNELLANGIDVTVDRNLQVKTMNECRWTDDFDIIFCNTLNFFNFLRTRNTKKKTVWWLHDHKFFYEGAKKEYFSEISSENLRLYVVGPAAQEAISEYYPYKKCKELIYGVEDFYDADTCRSPRDKLTFTVIGYVNKIKGQDVALKAMENLAPEFVSHCRLLIVGNDETPLAKKLKAKYAEKDNICFTGILNREEIKEVLKKTDVLICSSRHDVMPTVCAEAMMNCIPCVVSDAVGTAKYIHDNNAGFVFKSENHAELAEIMEKIISDRSVLKSMGENARKLYENKFSMANFETELLNTVI